MIPFFSLKARYESIQEQVLTAVCRSLSGTQWIPGDEVATFEKEFCTMK
jgi:dTDP-4-amino-4,6-dideoxygalactose transaminase